MHLLMLVKAPLRNKLHEHERPSSPVPEHTTNEGHSIDWDNIQILGYIVKQTGTADTRGDSHQEASIKRLGLQTFRNKS